MGVCAAIAFVRSMISFFTIHHRAMPDRGEEKRKDFSKQRRCVLRDNERICRSHFQPIGPFSISRKLVLLGQRKKAEDLIPIPFKQILE